MNILNIYIFTKKIKKYMIDILFKRINKMKTLIAVTVSILYLLQELLFNIIHFLQDYLIIFKGVIIAIFGGLVDYILQNKNKSFSFKKAFIHCFIAGFTGYLSQKLCNAFNVNADLTGFLIGISGFAGTRMLMFFESLSKKIFEKISEFEIKVNISKKEDNNDKNNKK